MFGCIIDYAQWWLNMSYLRVIVILLSGLIIIVGGLKKCVRWVDKSQICFIVIYNFQAPNLYPLLYGGSVSTRHSRLIRQPLTMQTLLIDSLTLPSQTIDTENGLSMRGRTTHEDGNAGCDVCSTDNHRCIWTLQTWVPFKNSMPYWYPETRFRASSSWRQLKVTWPDPLCLKMGETDEQSGKTVVATWIPKNSQQTTPCVCLFVGLILDVSNEQVIES